MNPMESRLTGEVRPQLAVVEGGGRDAERRAEVVEEIFGGYHGRNPGRDSVRQRLEAQEREYQSRADHFTRAGACMRGGQDEGLGIAGSVRRRSVSQTRRPK